jgi:hypothetical protein
MNRGRMRIEYQIRFGLIALLHRLGMEHRKPKVLSRRLNPAKHAAFIRGYEDLMNRILADEAVIFADAAHPTHAVRPVGCWAPKEVSVTVEQSGGRDRLNIHGAIDLETGQTIMKDVLTVDALSTILLWTAPITIETIHCHQCAISRAPSRADTVVPSGPVEEIA